jgi:hypothetical protein
MNFLKKALKYLLFLAVAGYLLLCGVLYFNQESLLFHPEKLEQDFNFEFRNDFVERNITTESGNTINTLLFKQEDAKGVIFYLHGNANSLKSVGNVSEHFLPLGYDVFLIDYPGYGKSTNEINDQEVLFNDVQFVYEDVKRSYDEKNIVVLGYSIGTGIGAHLTSNNNPAALILHAPYYSMTDMMQRTYPFIPTTILKYELATHEYLKNTDTPVFIFHGVEDTVIPLESAEMLSTELEVPLYKLQNQGHRDLAANKEALSLLKDILNKI